MPKSDIDILWLVMSAVLVLLMQAGFLCLESGITRSKNAINVAMKNAADFFVSVFVFWLLGFALMFGASREGLIGVSLFAAPVGQGEPWLAAFFTFQTMFCATAATIVSGAVAERMRFDAYIVISVIVVSLIYPVFGHWAWGGALGDGNGWLVGLGFVDFAGSTVVHSVGGWVALAALLVIGPRKGRFAGGTVNLIPGSNIPLAMLGVLFFVVGWIGFNGGSTLAMNDAVPGIIANTILSAVAGAITAYLICRRWPWLCLDAALVPMNGALAGLVAITANCHAVTATSAVAIGAIGGIVMLAADYWLTRNRIDDAVGAVPVHLAAGMWGTVAVGVFGDPEVLGTGLTTLQQIGVQLLGVVTAGLWSFAVAYFLLRAYNRRRPLRVDSEAESIGLNVSEHGAKTELVSLLSAMEAQERSTDLSLRVPVEPFTEVGQIAAKYNRVMDVLDKAVAQTKAIVRDIREGILTLTQEGVLTSFNPGAEQIFGLHAAQAVGRPFCQLLHPDEDALRLLVDGGTKTCRLGSLGIGEKNLLMGRRADGSKFFMELTVTESSHTRQQGYTALVRDVTDRRRVEDQLFQEKERAQVTLESIADGVITTDADGRVNYLNAVAEMLTGWKRDEAVGHLLGTVFSVVDEVSGEPMEDLVWRVLRERVVIGESATHTLVSRSGAEYAVKHVASPIRDRAGEAIGVVVVFHDVTKARDMARQLSYQATHDSLTGLLNRAEFETRLGELITNARVDRTSHVLCYLDLDQFKLVNDTCGHIAGDELLRQLSGVLRGQLRASDTLARLGGDEFGIILYDCETDKGVVIANALREAVKAFRFPWKDKQFAIGVSIGLVGVSQHTEGLPQLLSLADAACYAAKDLGRNRVHVYQADDEELAKRQGQMQWVSRIQHALDADRFRLYFQAFAPIGQIAGPTRYCEIFVRMLDEEDSIVPPGAFIPAAERYNLMPEIDRWVLQNALGWLGDHHRLPGSNIVTCAINLSGASVGDEACLGRIEELFRTYGVPPELVCFEVTETVAVANLRRAAEFIRRLKAIGCRFALDDFGSGLSSFEYLKNLPVDYLKIDGTFIRGIDKSSVDYAMVQSINSIGRVMGLQTIAEFVETEEVLQVLRDLEVDYVQGYHIAKPRPLEQLEGVRFMPR